MDAKTFAPLYRLIKWGIACFYKMDVVGRENLPEGAAILDAELALLGEAELVSVLCTCAFYIWDYNPGLLA